MNKLVFKLIICWNINILVFLLCSSTLLYLDCDAQAKCMYARVDFSVVLLFAYCLIYVVNVFARRLSISLTWENTFDS